MAIDDYKPEYAANWLTWEMPDWFDVRHLQNTNFDFFINNNESRSYATQSVPRNVSQIVSVAPAQPPEQADVVKKPATKRYAPGDESRWGRI